MPKGSGFQQAFGFYKVQRHVIERTGFTSYNEVAISTNDVQDEYYKYPNANLASQLLHISTFDGSTQSGGVDVVNLRENGQAEARTIGTVGFGVTASGDNSIGWRNATSSQGCTGFFQEVIVYHSDQTINTAGIETNINTYFSIY